MTIDVTTEQLEMLTSAAKEHHGELTAIWASLKECKNRPRPDREANVWSAIENWAELISVLKAAEGQSG